MYVVYLYSGGGYFVSYRDKLSDNYSPNIHFAKKFRTIGGALSRLNGISWRFDKFYSEEDFYNKYASIDYKRNILLSDILDDSEVINTISFKNGYIQKVDENMNFLPTKEVFDDIKKFVSSRIVKKPKDKYVDVGYKNINSSDVDFWEYVNS